MKKAPRCMFEEAKQVKSNVHSGFVASAISGYPDALLFCVLHHVIVAPL